MGVSISDFRTMASSAVNNGDASAVMRISIAPRLGTAYVRLGEGQRIGTRTAEFKADNLHARQVFAQALSKEIGVRGFSLQNLPPALAKALKVADFKFDADGKVTSHKPLTARRVLAITDALTLAAEEKPAFEELNGFDHGSHITVNDKVAMAKFLPNGFKALEGDEKPHPGKMIEAKPWHAHVALDIVNEFRQQGASLPRFGTHKSRLSGFAENFARAVASKMTQLLEDVRTGNSRYGKHELAMPDRSCIVEAAVRTLMAAEPRLASLVRDSDAEWLSEQGDAHAQRRGDIAQALEDRDPNEKDWTDLEHEGQIESLNVEAFQAMSMVCHRYATEGA